MINSSERSDILVFNNYLCHVRFLLTFYVCSTKIGEISDISKCFENFVSQTLGVLKRIYTAELRGNKNSPHANQKKKEANGDRYEEYKREYNKLKSSPNKTPEVKKQIEKLKRQMNRANERRNFSGENHSKNHKGNR